MNQHYVVRQKTPFIIYLPETTAKTISFFSLGESYELNACIPPSDSYIEIPTLNVIVLGGVAS